MSWVNRENVLAPAAVSPMAHNQPYFIEHGLVSEDMVQRYSHGHNLYATDNDEVYDLLDTSLRVTKDHSTIVPFKSIRDSRGAYISLKKHFCRPVLWDKIF